MALRASPIAGLSLGSLKSSSSSSFSFSANRPCLFMVTPHKFSFLRDRGEEIKVTGLRFTYNDRIRCTSHCGGLNLFARVGRIIRSYTDAILSSFEDPEKILEQAIDDMNNDLAQLRQAAASVLATRKQLEEKYKDAQKASEHWYQKAQLGLSKGDEGLTREALSQRKLLVDHCRVLKAQLDQQSGMAAKLVYKTQLLERKIQEANLKKDSLQARATAAKSTMKVQSMIGNLDSSSGLSTFGRMEEKVLTMEARAEALHQLTTDHLEEKFKMLEAYSVEDEFDELKRLHSMSIPKIKELPPGKSENDAVPFPRTSTRRNRGRRTEATSN